MPFVRGFLRVITRDRFGRPVDPGYGVEEGAAPGQGLPGGEDGEVGQLPVFPGFPGFPEHPGHLPARPGGPGEGGHPGQGLPRPPWERPSWPPGPTDPQWGIEEGAGAGNELPGEIPLNPDNTLPPEEVPPHFPLPPIALPPGSIWPPLPPSAPPGVHMFLVYISGVGHRYGVFTVPEKPERPERPEHPGRPGTLPGR